MDPLASASFQKWLLEQAPVVVVLGLFVMTLLWLLKRSSDRVHHLEERNEKLSDSLAALVRSSSDERASRATDTMLTHESILRTTLQSLESALLTRPPE
jgi:di/tricarboxylate transporter